MARPNSVATAVATRTPLVTPTPSATPSVPAAACTAPSGTLAPQGLTEMDVNTLVTMTSVHRLAWYATQLGGFANDIRNSASCNGIPPQLLATVILNELADINWTDVWQQRMSNSGSLGIAQIQVNTAKTNRLVAFPADKSPMSDAEIARRLTIPQYAIEAAAREIQSLLDKMTKNLANPWQQKFAFSLPSLGALGMPNDIYNFIAGATQRDKEANLAEMVVAAYNSPGIIMAKQTASITPSAAGFIYRNGTIHGGNSRYIAMELYQNNLFH